MHEEKKEKKTTQAYIPTGIAYVSRSHMLTKVVPFLPSTH